MNQRKKLALVTGANKGLGFEICRQLYRKNIEVILTSRNKEKGLEACEKLKQENIPVDYLQLDVTDEESIKAANSFILEKYGYLDILINNAGVLPDPKNGGSFLTTDLSTIKKGLETNFFGPFMLCQTFIPLMMKGNYGRIVNVSSVMGQIRFMQNGFISYRISKLALNAFTKIVAAELRGTNILMNTMCPGWMRTDLGSPNAPRSAEQGAETAIWLATLPDYGPRGTFIQDRKTLEW